METQSNEKSMNCKGVRPGKEMFFLCVDRPLGGRRKKVIELCCCWHYTICEAGRSGQSRGRDARKWPDGWGHDGNSSFDTGTTARFQLHSTDAAPKHESIITARMQHHSTGTALQHEYSTTYKYRHRSTNTCTTIKILSPRPRYSTTAQVQQHKTSIREQLQQ